MKSIIITGAASGIGREATSRLLKAGWKVFALDLADEGLAALSSENRECGDRLVTKKCDVADPQSVASAFADVLGSTDKLDALLCSAGILRIGPVATMSVEDFDALFDVNTRGPWLCMRAAFPALQRAASPEHPARVVMISSISAIRPKVGSGAYAASKAALSHLTRVLAAECASDQVLVNAIAPGTVNTPFIKGAATGAAAQGSFKLSGAAPLGRVSDPADIVAVVEFLLSDGARFITGVTLPVDGGTSAAFIGAVK